MIAVLVTCADRSADSDASDRLSEPERAVVEVLHLSDPVPRLARAANHAIATVRSRYLAWLTDAWIPAGYLCSALEHLERSPHVAFVSYRPYDRCRDGTRTSRIDLGSLLVEHAVASAAVFRRFAFEVVGGFDETLANEHHALADLCIRMHQAGLEGEFLPDLTIVPSRADVVRPGGVSVMDTRMLSCLIDRHGELYRRHVSELLARQVETECRLLRDVYHLEWSAGPKR